MQDPKPVKLTGQELEWIKREIDDSNLTESTKSLINGLIQMCIWLQLKLEHSKVSITKLKRLFFINNEKRGRTNKNTDKDKDDKSKQPSSSTTNNCSNDTTTTDTKNFLDTNNVVDIKKKGHGRLSANDYTNSHTVLIPHPEYEPGQDCPTDCGGRLYDTNRPGLFIHIEGNSLFKATKYETQALRCSLCGEYYKADKPAHITDKYDETAKAVVCVQKYQMGMPLYRLSTWQNQIGIPMPDTTMWEMISDVNKPVSVIFDILMTLAAQSDLFYQDDTFTRILSVMANNKNNLDKKSRTGMFTTGIIAYYENHPIYLFLSGTNHAGENLDEVLTHRDPSLPPPIQMCDALSRNHTKIVETILCYCLVHGRRNFVDIESLYPEQCSFVLDSIALVYKHEAHCRNNKLSSINRLEYHQKYSKPVMDELKAYINNILTSKQAEPNGPMGKAIRYMLNHWDKLTKFLSVDGAPLDTNIVERSLKLAIRVRKASLFFKTTNGTNVANHMMTVIHTALQSNIEPVAYLTALQKYEYYVFKEPYQWLPWNYLATINKLNNMTELAA